MAYIIISEEEKRILVKKYVEAHEEVLMHRFKEDLAEYPGVSDGYEGDGAWVPRDALEYHICYEAFDGCDSEVIKPLVYECDDWDRIDLVGDEDWSVDEIEDFITAYVPDFSFTRRDYVDDRGDLYKEGDDLVLFSRYKTTPVASDSQEWPFDSFSDHFDSEESERLFWESSI